MDLQMPRVAAVSDTVRGRPDDVAVLLTELSVALVDEEPLEQTLQRIVDLAVRTIPGVDAAGITLVVDGVPRTSVFTDERTLAVDHSQYEAGEGPCLEAYRRQTSMLVDLRTASARWPKFATAAAAAGVECFLAAPLVTGDRPLGALNLYSRENGGFDALDQAFVGLIAAQASAAIANAQRYENTKHLAEQLAGALASRAIIEQAKGVLMARQGVDAHAAFDLLRRQSQHRNVKLRAVAQEIVDSARRRG
jgi:GAF domain-containing protein